MIYIPIGLPGCGKTTCFKKRTFDHNNEYFDGDSYSSLEALGNAVNASKSQNKYIDGLFLTDEVRSTLLSFIDSTNITFIVWNVDREACLYNDTQRNRDTLAAITINNARVDTNNLQGRILNRTTIKYTPALIAFQTLFPNLPISDLCTHEWSNGGDWRDCWGNGGDTAKKEPLDINLSTLITNNYEDGYRFEEIIKKLGITEDELISYLAVEDFYEQDCGEGDYYGGYESKSCWAISCEKLLTILVGKKYGITDCHNLELQLPEIFL